MRENHHHPHAPEARYLLSLLAELDTLKPITQQERVILGELTASGLVCRIGDCFELTAEGAEQSLQYAPMSSYIGTCYVGIFVACNGQWAYEVRGLQGATVQIVTEGVFTSRSEAWAAACEVAKVRP